MSSTPTTLRELTIRYGVKADASGQPVPVGQAMATPAAAAQLFLRVLGDEATEVFALVLLSTRHHVLAYHEVSRGSLNSTVVQPRDVFKAALLGNAAAVILAHVHPSGDPTPSPDDVALTRRLVAGGVLLGVDVLDHIVVGDGRYASFRELGLL